MAELLKLSADVIDGKKGADEIGRLIALTFSSLNWQMMWPWWRPFRTRSCLRLAKA